MRVRVRVKANLGDDVVDGALRRYEEEGSPILRVRARVSVRVRDRVRVRGRGRGRGRGRARVRVR